MRRNLIRIRNGIMPASPTTPQEISENFKKEEIMREYGMTISTPTTESTPFFRGVIVEHDFAYCIFASQRIIDEINHLPEESRHYFMDGTFKVVPFGKFNQLLIIYIEFFQKVDIVHLFIYLVIYKLLSLSLDRPSLSFTC